MASPNRTNNLELYNAPLSRRAIRNPTVNDDYDRGFTNGSMWMNTSTHKVYVAESVAVGAAVWTLLNPDPTPPAAANYIPYAAAWLIGANANITGDQAFTFANGLGAKAQYTLVTLMNASGNLTGATGCGIYSGAGGTGTAVWTGNLSALTGPTVRSSIAAVGTSVVFSGTGPLYYRQTTPLGSAGTFDIFLFGNPLNGPTPS